MTLQAQMRETADDQIGLDLPESVVELLRTAAITLEDYEKKDALRRDNLEEVGWNRYRVLINSLRDNGNAEIAEDLRLLVRFASATHQYLGRTKELDYVCKAFMDLPLGKHGTHF